jgi:cytochrome c oxidase subunit IV
MTEPQATSNVTVRTDQHAPAHHSHPSEKEYLKVAGVLFLITMVEVALYYVKDLNDNALIGLLAVLSLVKFAAVVLWFMHLKFDSPLFRRLFVTGMILAVSVYLIVLFAMGQFSESF